MIADALKYSYGKEVSGKIIQVMQFNMTAPEDGVSVTVDNPNEMTIQFTQWGNWLWYDGIGASGYRTTDYEVIKVERGYKLIFPNGIPEDAVFIYTDGKKWRRVWMDAWKK